MKKTVALTIMLLLITMVAGCGKEEKDIKPELSKLKAICELATMDCYYHNVAKVKEEDAGRFLFWKKDKHFWIEYSGIITLGIDVSLLNMEVKENHVTITMPEAEILSSKIDPESLTKNSYIVDKDSVEITAEDETVAITLAQENMEQTAAANQVLLDNARQRAQDLLEEYVENIGSVMGIEYEIDWNYIEADGTDI